MQCIQSFCVDTCLLCRNRYPLPFALGKYILAAAADELPAACRAAFAIASPVVAVSHLRTAITATRTYGCTFEEIAQTSNRYTLVDLPANVDVPNGAALAFQHVLPA